MFWRLILMLFIFLDSTKITKDISLLKYIIVIDLLYIRTIVKEVNWAKLFHDLYITENKMLNTSFVVSLIPSLIVTRRRSFIVIWSLKIFCWDIKTILERLLLLISVLLVRYNYNNTYYYNISVLLIHYWTHTVVLLIIWLLKS